MEGGALACGVTPTSRPVSRLGRALDLLALLLVTAGAMGYVISYIGLERLRTAGQVAFARGMAIEQIAEYDRLVLISRWGLAGIIGGVACGVAAWWLERRRARSSSRA